MFRRKTLSILTGITILVLASIACGISIPGATSIDSAATSVAATIGALAETVVGGLTPEAHTGPVETLATLPPPSPLKVSFVGPDRNLYVWTEGTVTVTQLTSGGDVDTSRISPDGNLIVFTRSADYQIYSLDVINFDGTNLRNLISPAGFDALPRPDGSLGSVPYQIEWIPGGHTLAMNTRITYEGPGLQVGDHLYTIDADTGLMNPLVSIGHSWQFTYSHDGSKFAISLPTGIDVYNADGTKLAGPVLTYPFVNTASEYAWVSSPIWSSDNTTLAVAVPPVEPWTETPEDSTIWRVAADGLSGEQTASLAMRFFPGGFAPISPDLNHFTYFTRYGVPTDNMYTLHTANLDGSAQTDYANGKYQRAPVWSPDNTHFFYYTRDGATGMVYIGQIGTPPILVTDYTIVYDIQWVDATHYIVSSGPDGGWRLLYGTIGAPTGLIYSTPITSNANLTFSINR